MILDALLGIGSAAGSQPFLAAIVAGTLGPLGAALALGLRHGMDWDHIAAITDITSTAAGSESDRPEPERPHFAPVPEGYLLSAAMDGGGAVSAGYLPSHAISRPVPSRQREFVQAQKRPLALGTVYALGHGSMVIALGLLAILFSEILPTWVDPIMERVVGVTLVFLGCYLLWSLFRYVRHGGTFRIRSRWMLVFSGFRRVSHRLRRMIQPAHHHPAANLDHEQQYGVRTAYGIGLIHGIGAETGTQVLIIGAAVGAASTNMSIATLFVFVFGLLLSNSFITVVTAAGFISAGRRQWIYVVVGALAAVFSLALGLLYLTKSGGILPDLDPYFRWIGGPS